MSRIQPQNTIWVNGSWIDREYFRMMLQDAVSVQWDRSVVQSSNDDINHVHCYICSLVIPANDDVYAFCSPNGWICSACWAEFIYFNKAALILKNNDE